MSDSGSSGLQPEHRPKADTNAPDAALPAQLPVRSPQGHKGTFGTVLVVGGCSAGTRRMIGAPALAAMAALRAGAGLARLLVPTPILDAAIAIAPSATGHALAVDADGAIIPHLAAEAFDTHSSDANCLVVGPGLGDGPGPTALALRAVQHADVPVVVDADALNCLADLPDLTPDVRAAAILTPHPGEYRRLADALRIKHDPTNETSRTAAAEALAQRLGVIVALKGARTVVSDGQRTWTCRHQCPALATAGTGDVLAGLIAGLVAQFVPPLAYLRLPRRPADRPLDPWQATCLAVEAHALAGQRWADRSKATGGMLASELADQLPPILESLRKSPGP